jgi:hypothetical protein
MPDGQQRTGVFSDSPNGECQPRVTTPDGRWWRVSSEEMDRLFGAAVPVEG